MKTLQTTVGIGVLLLVSPVRGDLVGVHTELVDFSQGYLMADGSLYSGPQAAEINLAVSNAWATFSQTHAVFRFYADFDNPADRLVFFGSHVLAPMRGEIISPASNDFFDPLSSNLLAPHVINMATNGMSAFDSWITIGASSVEEAMTGDGILIAGPLPTTFTGGLFVPPEESAIAAFPVLTSGEPNPIIIPDAQGRVLYAQITVPLGTVLDFDGTLIFRPNGTGGELFVPFKFKSLSDTETVQCPADANRDGNVGIDDFLAVLAEWGSDCSVDSCTSDGNLDGTVGIDDFLNVLADWGACP